MGVMFGAQLLNRQENAVTRYCANHLFFQQHRSPRMAGSEDWRHFALSFTQVLHVRPMKSDRFPSIVAY